jgi:hypothetical protein
VFGRVDGPAWRVGVALVLVRESLFRCAVFRAMPATLDERVVPWLPSRACSASVDAELAVGGVADAAQRFLLRLPLGLFALVLRASTRVERDLGDRGDVDRVVQLAISARVSR